MSEGNTEIEGATAAPVEGVRVKDAGEFAAYWNGLTPEGREAFVGHLREASDGWLKCFQEDHERQLEQIRRLHEVATERTVQLAAVIEKARVALDGMDVYQYEADSTYIHDVRKALAADTDAALREVRAKAWDEGHDEAQWANGWSTNLRCPNNPHREDA